MSEKVSVSLLRLKHIIGDEKADPPIKLIIPISKTAWWKGVAEGKYPQPIKISEKVTVWRSDQIEALIEQLCAKQSE